MTPTVETELHLTPMMTESPSETNSRWNDKRFMKDSSFMLPVWTEAKVSATLTGTAPSPLLYTFSILPNSHLS